MAKAAGDLKEYAQAVKKANKQLGITGKTRGKTKKKLGEGSGQELSSLLWAHKIYGVDREGRQVMKERRKKGKVVGVDNITERYKGKYTATIQARIANFTKPAPWWKLLNDGNLNVRLPKSQGVPYPTFPATRFVQKSASAIRVLAQGIFKDKIDELSADYQRKLNDTRLRYTTLYTLLGELLDFLDKIEGPFKIALEKLKEYLGKKVEVADRKRLEYLARELSQGKVVNPRSGIRLGREVRIRTIQLERQIRAALQGK